MSPNEMKGENKTPAVKAPLMAGRENDGTDAAGRKNVAAPGWSRWRVVGICVALAVLVFGVFGQTVHFGFIDYDDDDYVYTNPVIAKGLTLAGVRWAFTHTLND